MLMADLFQDQFFQRFLERCIDGLIIQDIPVLILNDKDHLLVQLAEARIKELFIQSVSLSDPAF